MSSSAGFGGVGPEVKNVSVPVSARMAMHALLRDVTVRVILPRYQKLAEHEITA